MAIAIGWFLSIGIRLAYPVLLPYLQTEFEFTFSTAGYLLTVLWVMYALGQLPGGLIGDRIGEGAAMSASMLIAAVTLALIVFGGTLSLVFFATASFGFALALFGTVRLTAISDVYPEQRGVAIGFIAAAGDVGNTVLPPVCGFIAATIAWQVGFGFAIPLFVLAGVYIWVVVPTSTAESRNTDFSLSLKGTRSVLAKLNKPAIIYILLIQIIGSSIHRAFTGFYPLYLIEVKGLTPTVASILFAFFFAFGAVIKPISGTAYDQVGSKETLLILMGVSGIGFVVLPFVEHFWSLIAVTAIIGFTGGRGTVSLAYMTAALPEDILNSGLGTLRTTYMVISAASPALFGLLADSGFFDEAFVLLSVVSVVSLFLIRLLPKV